VASSEGAISGNFVYQPLQITDSNMVGDCNSMITIDERPAHQFQWREDAIAYGCMSVEVVNHIRAIEDSTRFFMRQACVGGWLRGRS